MNVTCSTCPAKYAVPDEKVAGRKVRITCKRCGTPIVVDGTSLGGSPGDPAKQASRAPEAAAKDAAKPAAAARTADAIRPRTKSPTIVGGLTASPNSAPGAPGAALLRPAQKTGTDKAAVAAAGRAASLPRPAPVAVQEKPWTVAVTDDDHRDLKIAEIVEIYADGTIDADTFIWREGMPDWLTPFEIPEIAKALTGRGLQPRTNAPAEGSDEETSGPRSESGAWHEPGRIRDGEPRAEANYDEVTVAMAGPKAQELLDAVAPSMGSSLEPDADPFTGFAQPKPRPDENDERPAPSPAAGALPEPAAAPLESEDRREPEPVAKQVATRAASRRDRPAAAVDLFSKENMAAAAEPARAPMPSAAGDPHGPGQSAMTGARNESSVLFSLDQLTKPQAKSTGRKSPKQDAEAWLMDSGVSQTADAAPPSVANLGGGTLFGTGAVMAAPDFTAPVPRSQPSNPAPASVPAGAPVKKGVSGAVWALLAAVVLAGGGGIAFMMRAGPAPTNPVVGETSATATASAETPPGSAQTASAPAASESAAASGSAEAPTAGTPSGTASATATATQTATGAPTGTAALVAPHPTATATAAPGATAAPTATATAMQQRPAPKPTAAPTQAAPAEGPEFDRDAAAAALATASASAAGECASADGPHGTGKVTVTFVNSGRATNAIVSGDFAGSALGGCIARVFRGTHVPAFSGDPVRVTKTVHIP